MREAGRAARTERAQAAKRGLSWSGGEGDGDARDEHDECGAGSERSGVGGNGDACEDPDAQGVRGGERVRGLGVHGSDGCHSRARIIAAAAAEASATRAGSDGDDDTGSCGNDSCGGCCCDDAAVTARARLASAAPQLSPDSIDTPTRRVAAVLFRGHIDELLRHSEVRVEVRLFGGRHGGGRGLGHALRLVASHCLVASQ